jgi:hypothetical protein
LSAAENALEIGALDAFERTTAREVAQAALDYYYARYTMGVMNDVVKTSGYRVDSLGGSKVVASLAGFVVSDEELDALAAGDAVVLETGERVERVQETVRAPAAPSAPTPVSKRPRPVVKTVSAEELDWDPVAIPLFSVVEGVSVRVGESYAVVRPGMERWPLGIATDHYRVVSHRATAAAIAEAGQGQVRLASHVISGHGYHVAYTYEVEHLRSTDLVGGQAVASNMVVVHDHTAKGSLRASMVVSVGSVSLGSVVSARALHVSTNPEIWQGEIDAMIERSILAQDALLDLLRAADAHVLTDADREFFAGRGMTIDKSATTALEAVQSWHTGRSRTVTWGIWERRLWDDGIVALCNLLGRATFGAALDNALGGRRYGGAGAKPVTSARTAEEVAA